MRALNATKKPKKKKWSAPATGRRTARTRTRAGLRGTTHKTRHIRPRVALRADGAGVRCSEFEERGQPLMYHVYVGAKRVSELLSNRIIAEGSRRSLRRFPRTYKTRRARISGAKPPPREDFSFYQERGAPGPAHRFFFYLFLHFLFFCKRLNIFFPRGIEPTTFGFFRVIFYPLSHLRHDLKRKF